MCDEFEFKSFTHIALIWWHLFVVSYIHPADNHIAKQVPSQNTFEIVVFFHRCVNRKWIACGASLILNIGFLSCVNGVFRYGLHSNKTTAFYVSPGPRINIKMPSHQYRKSNCGVKTAVRSSYLHNGISYTILVRWHLCIEQAPGYVFVILIITTIERLWCKTGDFYINDSFEYSNRATYFHVKY